MQKQRKNALIVRFLTVLLWMAFIFFFSQQAADDSSAASGRVAALLGYLLRTVLPGLGEDKIQSVILASVFWIRKGAHMSVYFVLFLLSFYAFCATGLPTRRRIGSALLLTVFYSVTDEIHQYFIPGRSCELRDVLIDTTGALLALALVLLLRRFGRRKAPSEPSSRNARGQAAGEALETFGSMQYVVLVLTALVCIFGVVFSLQAARAQ